MPNKGQDRDRLQVECEKSEKNVVGLRELFNDASQDRDRLERELEHMKQYADDRKQENERLLSLIRRARIVLDDRKVALAADREQAGEAIARESVAFVGDMAADRKERDAHGERAMQEKTEADAHVIQDLKRKLELHKKNARDGEERAADIAVAAMEEELTHAPPKQCATCTQAVVPSEYCEHCLLSQRR